MFRPFVNFQIEFSIYFFKCMYVNNIYYSSKTVHTIIINYVEMYNQKSVSRIKKS